MGKFNLLTEPWIPVLYLAGRFDRIAKAICAEKDAPSAVKRKARQVFQKGAPARSHGREHGLRDPATTK